MSTPAYVAAWLGAALLGAFLVAFGYYAWLGYEYLGQRLEERRGPNQCQCGHVRAFHYPAIHSCTKCRCAHYTAAPLSERIP